MREGYYEFDATAVYNSVCAKCPLVKMTRGDRENPDEYDCPLDFEPELIIIDDSITCEKRERYQDGN